MTGRARQALELKTGLFPDAGLVAQAIETLRTEGGAVGEIDLTRLNADDRHGWAGVVEAILAAELIVSN